MKKRGSRRRSHGSAWHWKQTDGWYYTLPGTKRRRPLVDENGKRVRGKENKQAAELGWHASNCRAIGSQPLRPFQTATG